MTGEYHIEYRNKYGAILRDISDTAANLGHAQDTARRRLFDPEHLQAGESHSLPTAYRIFRLIEDSEIKR